VLGLVGSRRRHRLPLRGDCICASRKLASARFISGREIVVARTMLANCVSPPGLKAPRCNRACEEHGTDFVVVSSLCQCAADDRRLAGAHMTVPVPR